MFRPERERRWRWWREEQRRGERKYWRACPHRMVVATGSSTEGVGSSPPHASLRRGSLLNLCVARAAFAQDPGDAPAGQGRWGGGKLGGVGEDFRAGCI
jgi:hypothetical protein